MGVLTAEDRKATCIHVAGHAVGFALGGAHIYGVAVAPAGVDKWAYVRRKGEACLDRWGVCEPAGRYFPWTFVRKVPGSRLLEPDRAAFERNMRELEALGCKDIATTQRQEFRAHLAGMLAGPLALRIFRGEDTAALSTLAFENPDDLIRAEALARLLPWRNEFAHAQALVERTLRLPAVWTMVLGLAHALEQAGEVDEGRVEDYLPRALPGWPGSPRMKERPFEVLPLRLAA